MSAVLSLSRPVGRLNSDKRRTRRRQLLERDGPVCGVCGRPIDLDAALGAPEALSLDHVIPVRIGGTHSLDNLQLTHRVCNEWRGVLGLAARRAPVWAGSETVAAVAAEAARIEAGYTLDEGER